MEYEEFRKEFTKYNKLFEISENEIEKFYQYMKLLLEWNEKRGNNKKAFYRFFNNIKID